MKIFGIASTENIDRTGESVRLNGMDINDIRLFNDEHTSDTFFKILGYIKEAKKIFSIKECTDDYQVKCWNLVKRPFLYVFGEIMDEHPNASAAASLIRFSMQNPDYPVGLSVEGQTQERDGSVLTRTKVRNVSLTVKPANPECQIFSCDDLQKSYEKVELPDQYKNVTGRRQFRNLPSNEERLLHKSVFIKELKELMKSDPQQLSGTTIMQCFNCGESKLFMKSRLPNRCTVCGDSFTMSDIYKARNKKPLI